MQVMDISGPCPEGYTCSASEWTTRGNAGYANFELTSFTGKWEVIEDAAPEGWRIYWKGRGWTAQDAHFDVVPWKG
jgi:hypothetical protein